MAQQLKGKLVKGPYVANTLGTAQFFYFFTNLVGGWTNPFQKYACQIGSNWITNQVTIHQTCLKPPPSYCSFWVPWVAECPWKSTNFCFRVSNTKNNATQPARRVVRQPLPWTRGIYMIYTSNLASFLLYFHPNKNMHCPLKKAELVSGWTNPVLSTIQIGSFPQKSGWK